MIPMWPLLRYQPTRVSDGHGGFTASLGTPTTIYGAMKIYKSETYLIISKQTDLNVGDIVEIEGSG